MSLEVSRSFIEKSDGVFEQIDESALERRYPASDHKNLHIRPFELKTHLKVGQRLAEPPTPFTIEWTPDILPRTRVGELRLQFQYVHMRNGHIDEAVTGRAFGPTHKIQISRARTHLRSANG